MMRYSVALLATAAVAAPSAAEIEGEAGPWTYRLGGDAALVLAPGGEESDALSRETALYEVGTQLRLERVLDNGAEIGVRVDARLQKDHPARAGFAGCVGGLAPAGPAGIVSAVYADCLVEDTGPRGGFETAHIYIDGGYGEATLGRDLGVGARLYEGPPTAFSHARLADPLLDPSGASLVRVRSNLSGPALKASYVTPRLLGVRAGVSYAPDADARGLDWDSVRGVDGARPRVENVWEAGVNLSRRLPESGVRVRAGATAATAEVSGALEGYRGETSVYTLGGELDWGEARLGVSALASDNGVETGGDYQAWSAGGALERFGLVWTLEYAAATDDSLGGRSRAWAASASREITDTATLTAGARFESLELGSEERDFDGLVVEITQSF